MIAECLVVFFLLVGTFFMFAGTVGLIRMPDLYCRMHAASKCVTLGISGLLLSAIIELATPGIAVKGLFAIAFQFLTTPVSAHMIARAAYYHLRVDFQENTFGHEWKGWFPESPAKRVS
jgi:multicomponent Na+:H+ antiporter subunit G